MSIASKISDALTASAQSAASIVKLLGQIAGGAGLKCPAPEGERIIILGNGPSLNQTIAEHLDVLKHTPAMAVNFAANAPIFSELRPRYYILVDPLFFSGRDLPNLNQLWQTLAEVDWPMTLFVPAADVKRVPQKVRENASVKLSTVRAVAVEGWQWLTDLAYTKGWGMPRPRNVLIPAIMAAIRMGYREIYITGADHSWMSTISVNERNEVISVQPHFYKEDSREVRRINTEYLRYPLHQVIHSFYVAFKSYHDIQAYAQRHGINIFNATPGSFIDAFERKGLPCR